MDVSEKNIINENHSREINRISSEVITIASKKKDVSSDAQGKVEEAVHDDQKLKLKLCRNYTLSIYKPLIPLKLALFCWFGAGSAVGIFITVFFKQRGITLSELSTVYMLSPIVQFLGPTLSGVIADKLGRSKPVLVVNVLISTLSIMGLLFVPRINIKNCDGHASNLKCHHMEFDRLILRTNCDIPSNVIELNSCNVNCPENVTNYCYGQNLICEILAGNKEFGNFSLSVEVSGFYKLKNQCYYNVSSMMHKNTTYSWCNVPHKMYCRISCLFYPGEDCLESNIGRTKYLVINIILYIVFLTTFSNCYRFMDVTSMALVKEHNSDFGRQRFFSITGVMIFAPLTGYIVDATTPIGGEKNYHSAFYLYFAMVFVTLIVIYKLEVQINPPGKKMWRKSLKLLKEPDVVAFALILFVIGTAWGFTKNFMYWYLEELHTPSFLLGLIPAMSSLYGLPFLVTSNWWVQKIGATQIFVLALLGYTAYGIGFSFLTDPWLALFWEVTNIFTYHLFWVAVITHSHSIAPEGLTATVIATAGGIHYSIGKGSGSLVGGSVMSAFGGRVAFRVVAIICLVCGVLYAFYLYIRKTCFTQVLTINHTGELNGEPRSSDVYTLESKTYEA